MPGHSHPTNTAHGHTNPPRACRAHGDEDTSHTPEQVCPCLGVVLSDFGLARPGHHPLWSLFLGATHRTMTHKQSKTPSGLPEPSLQGQSCAGKNRADCLLQATPQSKDQNVPGPREGTAEVARWPGEPVSACQQMPPKATPTTTLPSLAMAGPLK